MPSDPNPIRNYAIYDPVSGEVKKRGRLHQDQVEDKLLGYAGCSVLYDDIAIPGVHTIQVIDGVPTPVDMPE